MKKAWVAGLSALMLLFSVASGIVAASPSQQASQALTVERSGDRLSASATWTPNQGAEYQAFFVVAQIIQGEVDTSGHGIVASSFRYVDYPLAGNVGTLDIDGLDSARNYIYGVTSIARDSDGSWGMWSPWMTFRDAGETASAATDRVALAALHSAADGANWRDDTNWLTDAPLEDWYGVKTDSDGRVVEVSLWLNKMEGQIPAALGNLTSLTRLNLTLNRLNGEIPSELGMLSNLEELTLLGNQLTGEIPSELGNLTNLEKLYLSLGNRFTGCIPNALQNVAENDLSELELPFCS